MWNELPAEERDEYKKMILAFASLTEMFAQKAEDSDTVLLSPIINSKYQETVFQRVFKASAEDIGNTSFDASLELSDEEGIITRYLIGIKTFGIASGAQKVAQFKSNHDDWAEIVKNICENALDKTENEINEFNKDLYTLLAIKIARIRNMRIDSSIANAQGFSVSDDQTDTIQTVYHVLMPSKKGTPPRIYVGETNYDKINLECIKILGCTGKKNPSNFEFTDGSHKYKYTSADSQLYMDFDNTHIVTDVWEVRYAEDAYEFFSEIANKIYSPRKFQKIESHSWLLNIEKFSGFNGFYGVGSKLAKESRVKRIEQIRRKFSYQEGIDVVIENLSSYLSMKASSYDERLQKARNREYIIKYLDKLGNSELKNESLKILFRPKNELYIPIPDSVRFHTEHPDFFAPGVGNLIPGKWKLSLPKNLCKFILVFEPSGKEIESFITQDGGKAIESYEKQSYLGDWILRKIFQLQDYEPLTNKRLHEIGINGLRLEKTQDGKIHLYFIWIDRDNPPDDLF